MKTFIATCLLATSTLVAAPIVPLRGITYGQMSTPSGQEWQSPEAYAHGKLQPHATIYPFATTGSALRVLPEYSEYYYSLDGAWRFHWVGNPEERPRQFHQKDYDDSRWDTVTVPMSWNIYGIQPDGSLRYGTPIYVNQPVIFWHEVKVGDWQGGVMRTPPETWTTFRHRNEVGSYRRSFTVPKTWDGRDVLIQFEGVDSFFYLWVNGRYVGFSKNSRNRAEFDITPYLVKGRNTLAVEVYRSSDGSFLESQDMFRLPGIYRSVALVARPKVHIRDLQVIPTVSGDHSEATVRISADLASTMARGRTSGLKVSYQLYSLPTLYSDEGAELVATSEHMLTDALAAGESLSSRATMTVARPRLWSAEAPYRHIVVATLRDARGRVLDMTSTYTGLRQVEIRDMTAEEDEFGQAGRYFLINGRPAKLKGVNRHETHPAVGHAITREMMHEEVMLMKRANINHVRNSHYPTHPYFYYLADKYGLYLEDEANVESHQYYYGEASLSHVPEFDVATTNRMLEMVYANINHPSIVIWSLGNEAGPGVNFVHSYRATKAVDTSRPVQYERNNDIVDMGSNQYPSIPWVREAVKGEYKIKYPFHISEYAHSMGNALGGLQDYWDAIESTNHFCGAAIWDWVDQSMYHYLPNGQRYMAYGGDFGDYPNDGMFVMNGIVFADRQPKPQYYEVKKVYQHVGITAEDLGRGLISIFNKHYYTRLDDYRIRWSLYAEGRPVQQGELAMPVIEPRTAQCLRIPFDQPQDEHQEYFLKVQLVLERDMPWAKAGYVQAEEQLLVREAVLPSGTPARGKLTVERPMEQGKPTLRISGEGFFVTFDPAEGGIDRLSYAGREVITAGNGPRIDAFRAPCDNDNWAFPAWAKHGLHNLRHRAVASNVETQADGSILVRFTVESQAPNGAEYRMTKASGRFEIVEDTSRPFGPDDFKITSTQLYTIYPDGAIEVQAAMGSNMPYVPLGRLGFSLVLPAEYDRYGYYGRGPVNNYSDRKTAQFVEYYEARVADLVVPFAKPQTMGNREEVRYLTLTDASGRGVLVQAAKTMSASALPWSALELMLAPHPHDLPVSRGTHLHLDASVNGLGGNSCGQGGPLEDCRSFATAQQFAFVIRPYGGGAVQRVRLEGQVAPLISRSPRGEVSILGRPGNVYEYAIEGQNGGKYRRYTAPFLLRDAAKVRVRDVARRDQVLEQSFARIETIPVRLAYVSSEDGSWTPALNLLDGDPTTIWHTMYSVTTAPYPHWIDLDAGEECGMRGFTYLPRQDGNRNGDIRDYTLSVSLDGKAWTEVARGTLEDNKALKRILLPKVIRARYLRFTALNGHTGTEHAAGAEVSIIAE